jgi:Immunity protein 27
MDYFVDAVSSIFLGRNAMESSMSIRPEETEIRGAWIWADGKMVEDDASRRIRQLIEGELHHIATSEDGWVRLYRDPQDGRVWELSYPQGEMHGGGPMLMRVVEWNCIPE